MDLDGLLDIAPRSHPRHALNLGGIVGHLFARPQGHHLLTGPLPFISTQQLHKFFDVSPCHQQASYVEGVAVSSEGATDDPGVRHAMPSEKHQRHSPAQAPRFWP